MKASEYIRRCMSPGSHVCDVPLEKAIIRLVDAVDALDIEDLTTEDWPSVELREAAKLIRLR
jgi:hypothetical protein